MATNKGLLGSPVAVVSGNALIALLRRLEAATSRLEDIASQSLENGLSPALPATRTINASSSAPDISTISSQSLREVAPLPPPAEPLPPAISDMDELIRTGVQACLDASKGIDPLVEEQVAAVAKGFADQRKFLVVTTKARRPDPQSQSFMDLLKDLQQDLGSAGDIKDSNRGSPMKEHLSMVAEGINTLQWLVMDGKPADWVAEVIGGAQMFGNRILKTYKDGDQSHVTFVRAFIGLLQALKEYITKHYRTGVTWNAKGIDAAEAMQEVDSVPTSHSVAAPPPPSSVGPPPPPPPPLPTFDNAPPPPPPPPPAPSGAPSSGGAGDMGAVFEQLNKGESVTAGLRKVDKSQMTHKNPSLRATSTVPDQLSGDINRSRSPGPEIKPKPHSMRQGSGATAKKEGKRELDGNKWLIENWDTPSKPLTIEVSMTQSVLISRCKNTTVILRGKANAISVDNSPRTQLLLENLVSSIDVIKSPNFAVQITGSLPTILLDQVDGASIYLSEESLGTEVFTSKCSSINIVLPPEREEDDSRESPLPEQIRTIIKDRRVVHEIVEHAG